MRRSQKYRYLLLVLIFCCGWVFLNQLKRAESDKDIPLSTPDNNVHSRLRHDWNGATGSGSPYHPDIDIRGKWQQIQINKFCDRNHLSNLTYSLDIENPLKTEFYRHLLFDDQSKSIFCFIPKVGCTTARAAFFIATKKISMPSLGILKKKSVLESTLEQATKKSSFLSHVLTDASRISKLGSYNKYIIIRHPLQRLLSAYLDKLSNPLVPKNNDRIVKLNYFQKLAHEIIKFVKPVQYSNWNNSNDTPLKVEFCDFLTWVVEQNFETVNEHFAPQYYNSQPCRVHYHFYGNFNQFKQDFLLILSKLMVNGTSLLKYFPPKQGVSTSETMDLYWFQIPMVLRHKVYERFQLEFDFYHSLYPDEIWLAKHYLL